MRDFKIIIGAHYGDEGKGLMTDYFSALAAGEGEKALVVRHSGGAQAGHTVQSPEGARHVFHHAGSGSFTGADSYLSKYFLVNPILFLKEYPDLPEQAGEIIVSPEAVLTTPYDMIYNQMLEDLRGAERHGSCGAGIAATVERSKFYPEFLLKTADLAGGGRRFGVLVRRVRDEFYRKRFAEALDSFAAPADERGRYLGYLDNERLFKDFIEDCYSFLGLASMAGRDGEPLSEGNLLRHRNRVIFEGSQGLMLDQNHADFPYVTYANTGLRNADEMVVSNYLGGTRPTEIVYVTRAYLTRHGAGPLPRELPGKPYPRVEDRTNLPNRYQGALRFAHLDLDLLRKNISADLAKITLRNYTVSLAVTCLDQLDGELLYYSGGRQVRAGIDEALKDIFQRLGLSKGYLSFGPSRDRVREREF